MLEQTRTTVVIGFILAALAGGLLSACGAPEMPRPPEHYGTFALSPPVAVGGASHTASVASVQQRRLFVNETDKPLSSLTVTLELHVPETGAAWQLDGADFKMHADIPQGGRLLAKDAWAEREPNAMEVRRDGSWVEAKSVAVEPGQTRTVRLDFDRFTPYAVVGEEWAPGAWKDGWNAYYRPVGLQLTYPSPDGASEQLVIAEPEDASPTWTRDHVDTRLHMLVGSSVISMDDHDTGFLFGASMGAMHEFTAPVYLRWAADLQAGQLVADSGEVVGGDSEASGASYVALTAPITAGGVLRSTNYDMRLGAGWSTGIVKRKGVDPLAVPHYLVGEYEFVVRPNQPYPFRTHDFAGALGLYTRMSYQLGNLAERREPSGYLFTFGIALHP